MIDRTSHPLRVMASKGELEPCERGVECGLWASGKLTIKEGPEVVSWTVLTAAGCTVCPVGVVIGGAAGHDAIKVHELMPAPSEKQVVVEAARAHVELAGRVDGLPKIG